MADKGDVHVLSAIPRDSLKSVLEHGLLSSQAMLKNPAALKAFLESRQGTSMEETEEDFRARVGDRLKDDFWGDSMKGPSVFFGEPDPDKITENHPTRKLRTEQIKINLTKLMKAMPDTRIVGSELQPYDPEGPEHQGHLRHKDIDLEAVRGYTTTDPKELWKHYNDPEGTRYAGDVPHAQIVTPTGTIDPEYIETMDKEAYLYGYMHKTAADSANTIGAPEGVRDLASQAWRRGAGSVSGNEILNVLNNKTRAARKVLGAVKPAQPPGYHGGFHNDPSGIIRRTYLGGEGPKLFEPDSMDDTKDNAWGMHRAVNPGSWDDVRRTRRERDDFTIKAQDAAVSKLNKETRHPQLDASSFPAYADKVTTKYPYGSVEQFLLTHANDPSIVVKRHTLKPDYYTDPSVVGGYISSNLREARNNLQKAREVNTEQYINMATQGQKVSPRRAYAEYVKKRFPHIKDVRMIDPSTMDPSSLKKWPNWNPYSKVMTVPAPAEAPARRGLKTWFHELTHANDPSIQAFNPAASSTFEYEIPAMAAGRAFEMSPYVPEERRAVPEGSDDQAMARQIHKYGPRYTGNFQEDLGNNQQWIHALRRVPGAQIQAKQPFAYHGDTRTPQQRAQALGQAYQNWMNYQAGQ